MRGSKSLSATLGRVTGIGVPMVVGAVIAAAYLQLGVPHNPSASLPKAVEVVSPSTTVPGSGTESSTPSEGTKGTEAGKLIVVSPTNPVLAYEAGSSSPVDISGDSQGDGGETKATTTTMPPATTTTVPATTTTTSSDSNQSSGDSSQSSGDATTTTTSTDSGGGDN